MFTSWLQAQARRSLAVMAAATLAALAALAAVGAPAHAASRLRQLCVTPPGREWASFAYDPAQKDAVLFGGANFFTSYGDTWTWNGVCWTKLHPAAAPSARDTDSLAYDVASQRSILFGGFNSDAGRLGDTWAWDGSTWTQ